MIHVNPRPEPDGFDERVRKRGRKYLAQVPNPTQKQWNTHSFWREFLQILHSEYRGICAYSCHWIAFDTGAKTVEHFRPKTVCPDQAYEWDNYRLVCQLLNTRKRDNENILDPFKISDGWFVIDFPSLLVKPGQGLGPKQKARVKETRDQLGLNDEATCLKTRVRYIERYCKGRITFQHLQEEAPFLAKELLRQELVHTINDIMGYDPSDPEMDH